MATATNGSNGNAKVKLSPEQFVRMAMGVQNDYLYRSELLRTLLDAGIRDIDKECGYPLSVSFKQYETMYKRFGIAKRVVACMPEECWVVDPDVYETEEADDTPFEEAWKDLADSLCLYHYLHRIDEISGIGQFGLLFLGLNDGGEFEEPLRKGGAEELLYLRTFSQGVIQIQEFENDKKNPRYGKPSLYSIDFKPQANEIIIGPAVASTELGTKRVHWSRVIHIADERHESEVFGTPRMESVFNYLLDARKILSGSGEMYWKGAFPGFSFELHPEATMANFEFDPTLMKEEFEKYSEGLQRYMFMAGLQTKSLSPQVADPTGHFMAQLRAIAMAKSIPQRILFGSEEAKLASGQDAVAWGKRVNNRQDKYITPMILRPLVDRLLEVGVLPPTQEDTYEVYWPDIFAVSDMEKAQIAAARTGAMAQYVAGGVDQLVPPRIYLQEVVGLSTETIDAIEEELGGTIELEEQMPPGFPPGAGPPGAPGQEPQVDEDGNPIDADAQEEDGANQKGEKGPIPPQFQKGKKKNKQPTANYDPDQPRDDEGKWSETGGGGGSKWSDENNPAPSPAQPAPKETKPNLDEKLSKSERSAIEDYTLSDYSIINPALRRGGWVSDWEEKNFASKIDQLKRGIGKLPAVDPGTVVYRGLDASLVNGADVGAIVQDKGFLSTTTNQSVAGWYSISKDGAVVVITDKIGLGRQLKSVSLNPGEDEVLYPPKTHLTITKIERGNIDGRSVKFIHAEIRGDKVENRRTKRG